jgi:protein TonB
LAVTATVIDAAGSEPETAGAIATNGRPDGLGAVGGAPSSTPQNGESLAIVGARYDAAYLSNPKPKYPAAAHRLKLKGTTLLRVLVGPDGRPQRVSVETSSGFRVLDEAALEAVRHWSFVPARQGDKPIAAEVNVPMHFQPPE